MNYRMATRTHRAICIDGSHGKLFCYEDSVTISGRGDWPTVLRSLRVLLAEPRLDLLLIPRHHCCPDRLDKAQETLEA